MTAPTFYWHDYETFGRVPRRDRPAQFAGLRTDAELNEVGAPTMLYCRPAGDYLPDPESVLITGILPQHAREHGVAEHRFAATICAELGRDGTIGVGYNSLRFDDEVTRFLLWRNLVDPYCREWKNGCGRWDLLDVVRCAWALRPDGIEWPVHAPGDAAGKPSFRLEDLAAANGLAHDAAHDALSDVRATVALARLVRARQPRLWDFCLRLCRKDAVRDEIGVGRPFVHLSGQYATEQGCLAVVWPLAVHPTNRNELVVWDLAHDPRELAALDADTVRRRLFTRQAELPAGETRLPIKTVHVNKSPIVVGDLRVLGRSADRFGIDVGRAQTHAAHAAALGATLDALWPAVFVRPPPADPVDVDEDLYGGFVGDADRARLQRCVDAGPDGCDRLPAFDDPRLEELAFRWRARNFPETLDANGRERWRAHCALRLHHGHAGARTLAAYAECIDTLADAHADDDRVQGLLEALVDYAAEIAPDEREAR